MRLEVVRLLVADLPTSLTFYRDVLGMTVTFNDGENHADVRVNDDFSLALFRRDLMAEAVGRAGRAASAAVQDSFVLVFRTDDVDAAAQRLRDLGIRLETDPVDRPDWGIRTIHLRDPDGQLVELNSPLPKR
ncbi:MAG TPA: VOC family protein [Candidatus Limnocylindrales bacterium]|nr:VOC family protein [Candidatus Limnocylindrales bacterium]